MKRILYLSITHKFGLLVAFASMLLLKFILENVNISASLQPAYHSAGTILYWIYAAAMINLIIFLLTILITGNKKNEWKEWWEKTNATSNKTTDKLLTLWIKSMIVTIPIALYGSLFYGIIQSGWISIAILVMVISVAQLVAMNKKKAINQEAK